MNMRILQKNILRNYLKAIKAKKRMTLLKIKKIIIVAIPKVALINNNKKNNKLVC